ncbi:putative transpeptidase [Janibacter sp. HTCC2649]|uniref:penicillin-binding protein n=1 Tax=Janibacter sp. HTCC2649 TaxID=313589 RepID=UPI0000670B3E|nr:penicillin-binding protein [Janibacter sp. HTCC2649]EAQ00519.1 putative transpeptidase [Janibacter sp. HTCC2649]
MEGRAHNLPHVLRLLTGLVVLSALMGLLMAGLAIPAIGAGGSATKSGVQAFNDLPSEFTVSPLAQQSRIVDASNKLIANPYDENRIIVPLKNISPWMRKAQIAIEDSRFYEHGGLDVRGFTRAMVSNFSSGDVQGASTITQQYVKITVQENALRRDDKEAAKAAVEKTYTRKLQELKYALDVERNYTKDQILTGYLNLVYYGDQAYGVEAAAQNYFGISAGKLNLGQAALLAGIVQQPTKFNPVLNPKDSQARRNAVLDRMQVVGSATAAEVAAAKKVPVAAMLGNRKPPKGVCQRSSEPFFCAYMMEYLQKSPQMAVLGKTPAERLKNINQGGLVIKTTLNPTLQKATLAELTKAVPIGNRSNLGAASTVLEPGTGKILAMAQATDFAKSQLNLNVDQKYGGSQYGFQFGSTAKMYALVTALESGMPLSGTVDAPTASPSSPYLFTPSVMKDKCGTSPPGWKVENDYKSGGDLSLAKMTAESINTAFAQLVIDLGGCKVHETMNRMGLHQGDGKPIDTAIPAIALGAGVVTPMTIANSYATLAARGKFCEPTPIDSITTSNGKAIKVPPTTCKQVIQADVADGVNALLQGPLRDPRGTAKGSWTSSRPAAGKTGTTNAHNQSWFVGYTPQRAAAVWVGNLKISKPNGDLTTLNGKCFGTYGCKKSVFGGTIAGPVWGKIMTAATNGLPIVPFTTPSERVKNGNYVAIPDVIGNSIGTATSKLEGAGFKVKVGSRVDSSVTEGRVASTSPGSRAMAGGTITLLISRGFTAQPQTQTQSKPRTNTPKPTVAVPTIPTFPKPTKGPKPPKPTG